MTKFPTMWYLCLRSKMFRISCQLLIIKQHHTTTSRGYRLVTIKRYSTYPTESTSMPALVGRTNRFSCILNKFNMPFFADYCNFFNTNWMTKGVHRYTNFDSTTCIYVVASKFILFVCKILTLGKFCNTSILAHLCILGEPFFQCIR